MIRRTDADTATDIHAPFLPGTHTDIHSLTAMLRHLPFTGSPIRSRLYTATHVHTRGAVVSHTSTPAFSHSCSSPSHTPGCGGHKHAGLGGPGFGVAQPPFPCPELRLSVLSGAHTHAKLAGRVTGWQARHRANQAGRSQEQDGVASQPPPQLGVSRVSSPPRLPAPGPGQAQRVLPAEEGTLGGCWSLGTSLMTQGSQPPQPWPPASGPPAPLTSPAEAAAAAGPLLRQGKPSLCPAGWGRSHPDKEFDSSNPVVRQAAGREGGSRQPLGGGLP